MIGGRDSIKKRVRAVILLSSLIVLLTTAIGFLVYEVFSFKKVLVQNVMMLAAVMADNVSAPLIFDQLPQAEEMLAALQTEKSITAAAVYTATGERFASYPTNLAANFFAGHASDRGREFGQDYLVVWQPVVKDGKQEGTLYLRSSLTLLGQRLSNYLVIAALVLTGSMAGAFVLANILQRQISNPILALTETAKQITESKDYSVRVPKLTSDELGILTDAFNQMLDRTQQDQRQLKEAEEVIRTEAARLDALVAQRTAKLQETIGELEAFSYSISHDMRAPLRAMHGYAKALLEDYHERMEEEARGYLERIARAATRLDALIQDVLAYSRVAKGEIDLHPVDLSRLIADVLPNHPEFQRPRAEIRVEPIDPVIGHEAYLTQCVTNLLGNAVKFVEPGATPQVRVWGERRGEMVRVWFEDHGIGIDPSHHERIFEIFGQVYGEKKFGGTGIGLAIVRKAVQRMNGTVGLESELGKGTRFWINLRAAEPKRA